jgi:hypothetical protein
MSELYSEPGSHDQSFRVAADRAKSRFNLLAAILFLVFVGSVAYLVGWSPDLFILAGATVAVGVGSVALNRRRRAASPPDVDDIQVPGDQVQARSEFRGLRARLILLALILLNIVIDSLFLIAWFGIGYLFRRLVNSTGIPENITTILEFCFATTTLIPIGAFIVIDFVRAVRLVGPRRHGSD